MKAKLEKLSKKIYIIRVYEDEVEMVYPNEFVFAVVIVIRNDIAVVKALCEDPPMEGIRAGAELLPPLGVARLLWHHNGKRVMVPISKLLLRRNRLRSKLRSES